MTSLIPHGARRSRAGRPAGGGASSWLDRVIPWVLGGLLFLAVAPRVLEYGLTWDEPTYFRFARLQRDWIFDVAQACVAPDQLGALFSTSRIEQVWLQHPERNGHPPLNETWQGLVGSLFRFFGWHDLQSFRTAIALLFALTGVALHSLLRAHLSRLAALAGVLAFVGVPSVWAHAHLGATECIQLFFWILLATSGARALAVPTATESRWGPGWIWIWALLCGAAFTAKFTNLLAVLWVLATAALAGPVRRRRFWLVSAVGVAACPLGLLLLDPFFWPWLEGWPRFVDYLGQVGSRGEWIPIAVQYMGKNWGFSPPWHYRIVETVTTLPVPTLLLLVPGVMLGGIAVGKALRSHFRELRASRRDDALLPPNREDGPLEGRSWLLLLGMMVLVVTLAVDAFPATPNHDVTRQYVFVFVGVSLLVACAVDWILARASSPPAPGRSRPSGTRPRARAIGRGTVAAILASMTLLSFLTSLRAAPWGLSYRNVFVGGTSGAWDRGFEISYWGEAITPELLNAVGRLEPRPAGIGRDGDSRAPRIFSVPKLGYFHDAGDFWKPLVEPGLRDREVLAVDAAPAFHERWVSPELRAREGEFLRFTFRFPPDGILFFHRRGSVAESFDEVLRHLAAVGDLELLAETRIDDVSVARLYRVLRVSPVALPADPERRVWYQPSWIAELAARSRTPAR